jgi:hypothetical protein
MTQINAALDGEHIPSGDTRHMYVYMAEPKFR